MKLILPFLIFASSLLAQAEPLLRAGQSWDGGSIAYPGGAPEVTAAILSLEEGKAAPFHCHPVPTFGYVLSGTAVVETSKGDSVQLVPGQAVVEVMRTVHRGVAVGGPAQIMVFYAGAEGTPTTVLPQDDPEGVYCDK